MNFAASGAKAVKPLFSVDAFPSSVAGAKTKFPSVAACHWPSSKQGLKESTWPPLESPPPKHTFWNSGDQNFQGARSDFGSFQLRGEPTRIEVF